MIDSEIITEWFQGHWYNAIGWVRRTLICSRRGHDPATDNAWAWLVGVHCKRCRTWLSARSQVRVAAARQGRKLLGMTTETVGPFSAETVEKAEAEFYAVAERRDVQFGIWEYMGTYENPAGGVSIGWYYSDGLKEWGNRMDFDYSRKLDGKPGSFPDDAAAIDLAKHLGLYARESLRQIEMKPIL